MLLISAAHDPGLERGCEDARDGAVKDSRALRAAGAQGRGPRLPSLSHTLEPTAAAGDAPPRTGTGTPMCDPLGSLEVAWRRMSRVCESSNDTVSPLQVTAAAPALRSGTARSCLLDVGALRGNNDPHRGQPPPKDPQNDW